MITTLISLVSREEARALTIPQFDAIGIEPQVFLSDPEAEGLGNYGSAKGNAAVSQRALEAARAADADWLFLEDDIDINSSFPHALELARATGKVTYLYLHDDPTKLVGQYGTANAASIKAREPLHPQAAPLRTARDLNSSQAVFIPRGVVKHIPNLRRTSFDIHLWMLLIARRHTPYVVLPHAVQHRVDTTGRDPKRTTRPARVSLTYQREEGRA